MPIGKVTVCLCVCLFVCFVCICVLVWLRISVPRIKLAASNFARRFIGVQGRESHILGNFAPPEAEIGRIGQRAGHAHPHVNITVDVCQRKRHARHAPFVLAVCGHKIGMCGYMLVPLT